MDFVRIILEEGWLAGAAAAAAAVGTAEGGGMVVGLTVPGWYVRERGSYFGSDQQCVDTLVMRALCWIV